jgi:hypothetical protein
MVPDWKALLPHRPLDPDTDQYVPPPTHGGERIAQWILADRTTVLVAGPVGIGKSTELARAAKLLQAERSAFLVRLDRFENMKRVTVDQLLLRIAGQLATIAAEFELNLSTRLRNALARAGVLSESQPEYILPIKGKEDYFQASPTTLLSATLAEVFRRRPRRVTVLLDGLEKLPEGPTIAEVFEALGMLADDIDIVAILPWFLAFGAGPDTMVRPGEHLVTLRAPDVEGKPGHAGRSFLLELLAKRLGISTDSIPADRLPVLDRAATLSGGIPRTFLQLVADAGTYARMRRTDSWPLAEDLADAFADQQDSFQRILRKGDTTAILEVANQDGRELELERKIRLLTHGVLLERVRDGSSVLTVHPLVEPLLKGASRA